mmetsp:Transcript_8615/g.13516  ORF Transcript_8615/g.13516 Transcript_8615/m.13516 type:complete len:92 (-) Transcript_8615:75-350(-)
MPSNLFVRLEAFSFEPTVSKLFARENILVLKPGLEALPARRSVCVVVGDVDKRPRRKVVVVRASIRAPTERIKAIFRGRSERVRRSETNGT